MEPIIGDSSFGVTTWLVIAGVALVSFVIGRMSVGESKTGQRRQTAQTAATQAPAALIGDDEAEILGMIANGQMIHAIKRYRELTGCGLKEAKDAVEALVR